MKSTLIDAVSISDLWYQALYNIFEEGRAYKYFIDKGSYKGHYRLQYYDFNAIIRYPATDMVPIIPPGKGMGAVTDLDTIEKYFETYIIGEEVHKKASLDDGEESYTYGSRISIGLQNIIDMLKDNPGTNQAILEIAQPEDVFLECPPCLRYLQFFIVDGKLILKSSWRSNDLVNAFSTNLGGLQRLKEYIAASVGVEDGPMLYNSSGLHLYDFSWDLAKQRLGRQDEKE